MKRNLPFLFLVIFVFNSYAQTVQPGNSIAYRGDKNYVFTERTDLRRYDNNRYIGLMSREVKSFIVPETVKGDSVYRGNFFVLQKTKRAGASVNSGINDAIEASFKISSDGEFSMIQDNGFPSFRAFPSFPSQQIVVGDRWQSEAVRSVDPLEKGIYTKLPLLVEYTYVEDIVYRDEECFKLTAKWATRYGHLVGDTVYTDPDGDPELKKASGFHDATMYVSKSSGKALLVSDRVEEMFTYSNGNTVTFKGSISLFTEYPPAVNAEEIKPALVQLEKDNGVTYESTAAGTRLSIHDLQFKPDSAELLPGEENRLDKIAALLKQCPEKTMFLVEGHTARAGDESNEYELSLERAHTIAAALIARGIDGQRILCKGYGGSLPVASNDTEAGRKQNRRVEITILQ